MSIPLLSNGCLEQLPHLLPPLPALLPSTMSCSMRGPSGQLGSTVLPVPPPSFLPESIPWEEARVWNKDGLGAVQGLHSNVKAHQRLPSHVLVTNLKHSTTGTAMKKINSILVRPSMLIPVFTGINYINYINVNQQSIKHFVHAFKAIPLSRMLSYNSLLHRKMFKYRYMCNLWLLTTSHTVKWQV